jgi:predicted DNA-binding transcriptional regulator AlpA
METLLRLQEFMRVTGAKRSQIGNWARKGWLPSSPDRLRVGTGHDREFTSADVVAAKRAVQAMKLYGPSAARHVLLRAKGDLDG